MSEGMKVLRVRLTGDGWKNAGLLPGVGEVVKVIDTPYPLAPDRHDDTWSAAPRERFNYVSKDPSSRFGGVLVGAGGQVEHPDHYNDVDGMPEVWDILDAFFPDNPTIWNAGKYLLRYGRKGDPAEQLEKLIQYAEREREKLNARKD